MVDILKRLDSLNDMARIKVNLDLLPYLFPRLAAVEHTAAPEDMEILKEMLKTKTREELLDLARGLPQVEDKS